MRPRPRSSGRSRPDVWPVDIVLLVVIVSLVGWGLTQVPKAAYWLPPPLIDPSGTVGAAHYYGFSLQADSVWVMLWLTVPTLVWGLRQHIQAKKPSRGKGR